MSKKSVTSSIAKKASIKKSGPKVTIKEKEQKTKKIIEAVTASQKKRVEEEKQDESDVESDEDREESADDKEEEEDATKNSAPEAEKECESFLELGVSQTIQDACDAMNFRKPTPIQAQSIPYALEGRDIIGLAQTGSGKTAAFAIPILQALWDKPSTLFACVLAPTRELAYQISQQFEALGSGMGLRCAVIVGGMDMMDQALALTRKPHIVVATPGRLMDHLEHTKGFSLRTLKYLVLDEADRLLDMDFEVAINKILTVIPKERNTYLFSATMTSKVDKLQRASLSNPVRVAVSSKYDTVDTLLQYYMFIPFKHKDTYLVYLINEMVGNSIIIFVRTRQDTERTALILRALGFSAVPLHGQISQTARLGSLNKFKAGARNILVATDVVARGLDIPSVDVVINYDIPTDSKAYIHRVGRTARAGRSGKSISLVTQYDIDLYQRIEAVLQRKLDEYKIDKEAVMLLSERVNEAQREAILTLKANQEKKKSGRGDRGGRRGRNNDDKDLGEE
ncbi:hypothetical protein D0Z00_001343 [Geotrichum galactomycetum]|uniref:Uncharacterized protein n=1 Tax=Geotrichum galactomycetum TaxID=27317 RepID=A0ACB6V768_9ASCO|nr:hypothetical protein D0Z00_001343 [Geotrichum candidum]